MCSPTALHQRVPVFLGSKREVAQADAYHRDADARTAASTH
jgi:fructose-1,6-bisphosphatase I